MTCKEKNKMYPDGNFKMKFVGKPNGRLMKGAPGNYIHGETYMQPYRMSKFDFWELVEDVPELIIPPSDEDDSVFEETFYVPDEEEASLEMMTPPDLVDEEDVNIDPDAEASIDPYMSIRDGKLVPYESTSSSEFDEVTYSSTDEPLDLELKIEDMSRETLLEILEDANVEIKPRTRTTTLQKMVEELDSKE